MLARLLQDKLSASSVSVEINFGFHSFTETNPQIDGDDAVMGLQRLVRNELTLSVTNHEFGEFSLGRLELALRRDETALTRDMSAYFEVIGSLVSTSLLVSAREYFNHVLNRLADHLNTNPGLNEDSLFKAIEEALKLAGLSSLVMEMPGSKAMLGTEHDIKLIKNLPESAALQESYSGLSFYSASRDADPFIEAHLRLSKARLWFRHDRRDLVKELNRPSPWRDFLDRLAQMTDLALNRITAAAEFDALRQEAERYQGLAAAAVTTGTLLHQITNLARDVTGPATTLVDAYHQGQIEWPAEYGRLLELVSQSAARLLGLVRSLSGVTASDARRPCSLLDAVNQCRSLFEISLTQMDIQMEIDIAPELIVDVPIYVAVFALANLISNARDAIKVGGRRGLIRVFAEKSNGLVDCFVADNGRGVPKELGNRLFDLGSSHKPHHSGWGLYLVSRSMQENGGDVQLSNSDEIETKFRLRFPAATQEHF
jgi:signal transduction histidine kinase